jgi:transcriptional regulator with XRE-family HTH domain
MENICYTVFMDLKVTADKFGENLYKIRRKKGYTQAHLARITGISQRMIGHYETRVKRPSIDKVKKLADALGVADEELLGVTKKSKKFSEEDVSYKIMKKVRMIEKLPVRDQKAIFRHINSLVEKNKFREELKKNKN